MRASSGQLDELCFDQHRTPLDLAVDLVIAVDDTDPFDLGAGLELARLALDFQILDQRDVVAMVELIAIRIGNDPLA